MYVNRSGYRRDADDSKGSDVAAGRIEAEFSAAVQFRGDAAADRKVGRKVRSRGSSI